MMPAISQWPTVVSLPRLRMAALPNEPSGLGSAARSGKGRMLPRPSRCRLGSSGLQAASTCPRVSLPASPQSAASGISPTPQPSSTTRTNRLNLGILAPLGSVLQARGDAPPELLRPLQHFPLSKGQDAPVEHHDAAVDDAR